MSFEPLGQIVKENYRHALVLSLTLPLTVDLIDVRNGSEGMQMNGVESVMRKIFGELCFAALAVASLIEMVVRGIFFIPGLIIGALNPTELEEYTPKIVAATVYGPIACAANAIVSLAALIENFRQHKLVYDEIYPCATDYARSGDEVIKHCFAVGKWLA